MSPLPFPLTDMERDVLDVMRFKRGVFAAAPDAALSDLLTIGDREQFQKGKTKDPPANRIRAEFLRWLLDEKAAGSRVPGGGLRLENLLIEGEIDLRGMHIASALQFQSCAFDGGLDFTGATIAAIDLRSCVAVSASSDHGAFIAYGSTVKADVDLTDSRVIGGLELSYAAIGKSLVLDGAIVTRSWGGAIAAEGARIGGDCSMSEGFAARGWVNFSNAHIAGNLLFGDGAITDESGLAFQAHDIDVGLNIFFGEKPRSEVTGTVSLCRAKVKGSVNVGGEIGSRTASGAETTIDLSGMRIGGQLNLVAGLKCRGAIDCSEASIGGTLRMGGRGLQAPRPVVFRRAFD